MWPRGWVRSGRRRLAADHGLRLALIETEDATPLRLPERNGLLRLRADCADPAALDQALGEVAQRWGRIDGVFLSTPFSDGQSTAPLTLLGAAQHARVQHSAIAPLEALAQIVDARRIGFVCVQSSLAAVIGGVGLAAYAGGHLHSDVFAALQDRQTRADWYAIGWDMLATDADPTVAGAQDFALSPDQVWEMTKGVLAAGLTGATVVSRADVDSRRRQWLNPAPQPRECQSAPRLRARPEIATGFVAPRTATETEVAAILQDLLGLDRIGVEDGFFELGGHSLLAIRAIARLREAFPVEIDMRDLLANNPSAASIAALIDTKLNDDGALAALLAEVSEMSDEDLSAALAEGADR